MKYAFALAAIAGLAAAQPHVNHQHLHKKQAAAMETVTDWTVVTVTDVVTVYGPSPAAAPTSQAAAPPPPPPPASSNSPAPVPTSVAAPPVQPPVHSSPAAQSPSSAPAPPAAPSSAPQPKPVDPSSAAPAPPAQSSPAAGGGGGGGSGVGSYGTQPGASVAADCTKDSPCKEGMTTYTTGLGACGYDDTTNNDQVVALQQNMFGSVTNKGVNQPANPLCNKRIQITNPSTGATAVGVIRDRCVGCTGNGGIDLSPPLWAKLNDNQPGNRLPVEWYFLD